MVDTNNTPSRDRIIHITGFGDNTKHYLVHYVERDPVSLEFGLSKSIDSALDVPQILERITDKLTLDPSYSRAHLSFSGVSKNVQSDIRGRLEGKLVYTSLHLLKKTGTED